MGRGPKQCARIPKGIEFPLFNSLFPFRRSFYVTSNLKGISVYLLTSLSWEFFFVFVFVFQVWFCDRESAVKSALVRAFIQTSCPTCMLGHWPSQPDFDEVISSYDMDH